MAELLSVLSIISFVIMGLFFGIAVFLWIFFKIPSVINDLSGRTARKSIAKMRSENEKNGKQAPKILQQNVSQNIQMNIEQSNKIQVSVRESPETELLSDYRADEDINEETGIITAAECAGNEETGLLRNQEITAPLSLPQKQNVKCESRKKLVICEDIMLIHTDEVIGC